MAKLNGTVAVVTGASRGAGRGVALALGEAGATVYVTGRSVRGNSTAGDIPGDIDDTADEVTKRGGQGIPVRCDHTVEPQVSDLFERVRRGHGKLDVLVNAVWGGNESYNGRTFNGKTPFEAPFWEQDIPWRWNEMMNAGVWAYLVAARYAAPLMLPKKRGLIVHIADGDGKTYRGNFFWDLSHEAVNRMAYGMARELKSHNIAVLALSPGFMRTERVLALYKSDPGLAQISGDLSGTESPEYVGRAVAALAADPAVMRKSGQVFLSGDLAREYGFNDVDGRQPPPFRLPADSIS